MMGLFMFRDSFANIVMITFTALILIEILNVYTQVSSLSSLYLFVDPPFNLQDDADASGLSPGLLHLDCAAARVLRPAIHRR
jgi:hypothetical protein